jgi:xanthine dehydrogenase small subunit
VRSALSSLEVVRPRDLKEALAAMAAAPRDEKMWPIAGGTDLYVMLNAGLPPARYLDLWSLRELRGIKATKSGFTFGATTTFRDVREHAEVRRRLPALAAAAAEVGGWQIQNRATIGGNIANGSPAGDSLPVFLAHDTVVRVRSSRGERAIAFEKLYKGYRELALDHGELIVAVDVPAPPPRSFAFFRKVGTRRAQSISKVVFSGLLTRDRDGTIADCRLAFGSVAPVTMRARDTENLLRGRRPTAETAAAARATLAKDIAPIDDIRSSREYRVAVAGNVVEQFLRAAAAKG